MGGRPAPQFLLNTKRVRSAATVILPRIEDSATPYSTVELTLAVTEKEGWTLLTASGEIDLSNADRLGAKLNDLIDADTGRIAVDLREVTFMDSTGLRTFLAANERMEDASDSFVVIVSNGPVDRLFDITGLRKVIRVEADFPGA